MPGNHKIRVLHLIEHLQVGGAERAAVDIIKSLDPDRIDSICCVYRHIGAFGEELERLGYPVYFLKKSFLSDKLTWLSGTHPVINILLKVPFTFLESIVFVPRLAIFINRQKIDIVHSHLYSANFWGRLSVFLLARRSQIITTEHNTNDLNLSWKVTIANRLLAPCSARIVAVSKTVADSVMAMNWAKPEQLIVIPNGVMVTNDNEPKPAVQPANVLLPGDGLKIAIIAYLWPVKRHDLLFKAVKIGLDQGKQFTCLVIGDGPERAKLETLVNEYHLNDSIVFLGERYDVSTLLQQIDIVVSTSDTEGLPVNLLEALAAGVPVVATNVGGTVEIIKDYETGLLVEPGNAQAIANGICKMIDNRALAQQLGENGKKLVQQSYAMKNIARQWQALYEELVVHSRR